MARPLRVLIPDGIYHVTTRKHDRCSIFRSDADRHAFVEVLGRTVDRFDWRCLTYCLMDNHFHLVLRTPQPNLDRGMQQLKSRYAQAFNRRYDRTSALFDRPYHAVLVQRQPHALEVLRYVALNPVRAGFCDRPEAWVWSAHGAIAGLEAAPSFLAVQEARDLFAGASGADGRRAYLDFVGADGGLGAMPDVAVDGDESFLREMLRPVRRDVEIPRRYWGPVRPPIKDVMNDDDQAAAMACAYREHGYTMAEIAAHTGCHVSTVSRRIHAYERRMLDCKI
jgi:putative transposase